VFLIDCFFPLGVEKKGAYAGGAKLIVSCPAGLGEAIGAVLADLVDLIPLRAWAALAG